MVHRHLGEVELVRGDRSGISEVRLPSGEIRSVDTTWLKDLLPVKGPPFYDGVAKPAPPAPAKPDAKPK